MIEKGMWIDKNGKEHKIKDMSDEHIDNTLLCLVIRVLYLSAMLRGYRKDKKYVKHINSLIDAYSKKMQEFVKEQKRRNNARHNNVPK